MSFDCPYLIDGKCIRRNDDCVPGGKACVLKGRYDVIGERKEKEQEEKNNKGKKISR